MHTSHLTLSQERDLRLARAVGINVIPVKDPGGTCVLRLRQNEATGGVWDPFRRLDEAFMAADALGVETMERTTIGEAARPAWRVVFKKDGESWATVRPTLAEALTDGGTLILDKSQDKTPADDVNAALKRCWTRDVYQIKKIGDDWLVTTNQTDDVNDRV